MRFLLFLLFSFLSLLGIDMSNRALAAGKEVYGQSFRTIDGGTLPLADYRGKVMLIVNTASRCGFTKQYAGLQKLYDTYKDKGFVVIAVPSNDFAHQEPGSATEIKKFCEVNFNITFPIMDKVVVTGDGAQPFFRQVREEKGYLASPHWNFYKYLIDRDGHIVAWFSSMTAPDSASLTQAIEAALAKPAAISLKP